MLWGYWLPIEICFSAVPEWSRDQHILCNFSESQEGDQEQWLLFIKKFSWGLCILEEWTSAHSHIKSWKDSSLLSQCTIAGCKIFSINQQLLRTILMLLEIYWLKVINVHNIKAIIKILDNCTLPPTILELGKKKTHYKEHRLRCNWYIWCIIYQGAIGLSELQFSYL